MKRKIHKKLIKAAFIKSLPVMAGYIVLGIGFGILLKKAGYGLFWAFLMSFTIYAGLTCSIICLLFFGAENFLIPTMITITLVLFLCWDMMDTEGGGTHE